MTIPLSAKTFAEFMTEGPSKKAQIVRNIKKPKSLEAVIPPRFYKPANDLIRTYHAQKNDKKYLAEQLRLMETEIDNSAVSRYRRTKLNCNRNAVLGYMEFYGDRKLIVVPRPRIYYTHGDVRLSGSADLAISENGQTKLIKIGATQKSPSDDLVRIMLQVIYLAGAAKLHLKPDDVIFLDVNKILEIHGKKTDSDLNQTIDDGCEALAKMCA